MLKLFQDYGGENPSMAELIDDYIAAAASNKIGPETFAPAADQ